MSVLTAKRLAKIVSTNILHIGKHGLISLPIAHFFRSSKSVLLNLCHQLQLSSCKQKVRQMQTKEQKRKDEIVKKAQKACKGIDEIHVYRGFGISLETLDFTPEYVKMEINQGKLKLKLPAPKASDYPDKVAFKSACVQWRQDAIARANIIFGQATAALKQNGIRYRSGVEWGWPVARLA